MSVRIEADTVAKRLSRGHLVAAVQFGHQPILKRVDSAAYAKEAERMGCELVDYDDYGEDEE